MTELKLPRRAWMSGFGVAAAGVALGVAPLEAGGDGRAQAGGSFQPARHELDAWLDALPGKHRLIFDVTSAEGTQMGAAYASNFYGANRTAYQVENADLAVVLCLRHSATSFAFNNGMWAKYGAQLAEGAEYKDPAGKTPTTNPRNSGGRPPLDTLAGRGAHFAVCGLATRRLASMIARTGPSVDEAFAELSANTIANAHIIAAGVVAVARAQEYGYSLIHAG